MCVLHSAVDTEGDQSRTFYVGRYTSLECRMKQLGEAAFHKPVGTKRVGSGIGSEDKGLQKLEEKDAGLG